MRIRPLLVKPIAVAIGLLMPMSAPALAAGPAGLEPADTEQIFGLLEGSDIGRAGDIELEFATVGEFGRPKHFSSSETDASLRYGATDNLRVSIGVAFDVQKASGVYDIPNHNTAEASGIPAELRYLIVDNTKAPFGLTFSFAPEWRRLDAQTGRLGQSWALPAGFLFDTQIIPQKLFFGANLNAGPTYDQVGSHWETSSEMEVGAALSYRAGENLFVSAEIRRDYLSTDSIFEKRATFVGSGLTWFFAQGRNLKGFVSQQVGDPFGPINVHDFSRDQYILQLAIDL